MGGKKVNVGPPTGAETRGSVHDYHDVVMLNHGAVIRCVFHACNKDFTPYCYL